MKNVIRVKGILNGKSVERIMQLASDHLTSSNHEEEEEEKGGESPILVTKVEFRDVMVDEMVGSQEVMVSGASTVVPITTINGQSIGNGKPG